MDTTNHASERPDFVDVRGDKLKGLRELDWHGKVMFEPTCASSQTRILHCHMSFLVRRQQKSGPQTVERGVHEGRNAREGRTTDALHGRTLSFVSKPQRLSLRSQKYHSSHLFARGTRRCVAIEVHTEKSDIGIVHPPHGSPSLRREQLIAARHPPRRVHPCTSAALRAEARARVRWIP